MCADIADSRVTRLRDLGVGADVGAVARGFDARTCCGISGSARDYSAINTDLQAVNSR